MRLVVCQVVVADFGEVVRGITGAGSLVCERIAAQSAILVAAEAEHGALPSRIAAWLGCQPPPDL